MGQIFAWGAVIIASIFGPTMVEKIVPAPKPDETPTLTDQLFRISLILGIAVSGFTLYTFLKK